MRKLSRMFLIAGLICSAGSVHAHTDKSYLNVRSHGVNMAMENSGGWQEQIHRMDKNKFGGNFQVIGFYQRSTDGDDLGRYFLTRNKSEVSFGVGNMANTNVANQDLDARFIIHQNVALGAGGPFAAGTTEAAKLKLDPDQSAYGAYLSYYQDLEKLLKGLYFSINLPVVHVRNDLNISISGANEQQVKEFFAGQTITGAMAGDEQDLLTKALIKEGIDSTTGVADIDLLLGYRFLEKEDYNAAINLGFIIPTGNDPDGNHMFEAIVGNGQHFGFGGGLDFGAHLWKHEHKRMDLNVHIAFNYRYLFEASERRTLGIKGIDSLGNGRIFSRYVLLGKKTSGQDLTSFTPAANVTTLNVDVTPGSQFDGIINFAFDYEGFIFDAGYNLYFRESEDVKQKEKITDGVWGIAAKGHITGAGEFDLNPNNNETLKAVNNADLDFETAANPSQTTHKIYANLAYIWDEWETPVHVSFGGHYDFKSNNSALANWGLNGRIGISF